MSDFEKLQEIPSPVEAPKVQQNEGLEKLLKKSTETDSVKKLEAQLLKVQQELAVAQKKAELLKERATVIADTARSLKEGSLTEDKTYKDDPLKVQETGYQELAAKLLAADQDDASMPRPVHEELTLDDNDRWGEGMRKFDKYYKWGDGTIIVKELSNEVIFSSKKPEDLIPKKIEAPALSVVVPEKPKPQPPLPASKSETNTGFFDRLKKSFSGNKDNDKNPESKNTKALTAEGVADNVLTQIEDNLGFKIDTAEIERAKSGKIEPEGQGYAQSQAEAQRQKDLETRIILDSKGNEVGRITNLKILSETLESPKRIIFELKMKRPDTERGSFESHSVSVTKSLDPSKPSTEVSLNYNNPYDSNKNKSVRLVSGEATNPNSEEAKRILNSLVERLPKGGKVTSVKSS